MSHWAPVALSRDPPVVDWGDLAGVRFSEPFFDQTIERWAGEDNPRLRRTGLAALAAFDDLPERDPALLIFHMSRCGSTLLSRLLAQLPGTLVLSEPAPINALLLDPGEADGCAVMLRRLARALGREGERTILKLSSWNVLRAALFRRAFPAAPLVWVQREPGEVMASLLADRPRWLLPPVAAHLFGIADAAPEAALAALLAAAAAAEPTAVIDYRELPQAAWTRVAPLCGIVPDEATIARLAAEARYHAKDPKRQVFTGDRRPAAAAPETLRRALLPTPTPRAPSPR
jgi:hypothetical protein